MVAVIRHHDRSRRGFEPTPRFFKSAPPARATIEVARLPREVKIEISAVAVHP